MIYILHTFEQRGVYSMKCVDILVGMAWYKVAYLPLLDHPLLDQVSYIAVHEGVLVLTRWIIKLDP